MLRQFNWSPKVLLRTLLVYEWGKWSIYGGLVYVGVRVGCSVGLVVSVLLVASR